MTRLLSTMRTDVIVQFRNNLYYIGVGVALFIGVVLARLLEVDQMAATIPVAMLLLVGGSTLLYVAAMILFEKDEGTLSAQVVSPLTSQEYLLSKVITLTGLATLESIVLILVAVRAQISTFNPWILLLGIVLMCVIYTLLGIVLVVRYDEITEFLLPVLVIAVVAQLPALYFNGFVPTEWWFVIPTSAPTLIVFGAWEDLPLWQWMYALVYSAVTIGVLARWSLLAFRKHIILQLTS